MQEIFLFLCHLFATIFLAIGANAAISTAPRFTTMIEGASRGNQGETYAIRQMSGASEQCPFH